MHRMILSCPQSISFLTSRPPKWSPTALCITFTFTARVLHLFLYIPSLFQQEQPTKWPLHWNLHCTTCLPPKIVAQRFSVVCIASHLIKLTRSWNRCQFQCIFLPTACFLCANTVHCNTRILNLDFPSNPQLVVQWIPLQCCVTLRLRSRWVSKSLPIALQWMPCPVKSIQCTVETDPMANTFLTFQPTNLQTVVQWISLLFVVSLLDLC